MGNTFLQQILLEHYKKNPDAPSIKKLYDEKTQRIKDLSPGSGYMVDVFLEQGFEGIIEKTKNKLVKTTEGTKTLKTEIVDVLILIYELDKSNSQDLAIQQLTRSKTLCNVVLIEVKTNKESGTPGQLGKQIENSKTILNNLLEKDESSLIIKYKPEVVKELSMIYITPKGCKKYFDELGNKLLSNPKSHIYWSAKDNLEYLRNKYKPEIDIKGIEDRAIEKYYGYSVESIINKIINNDFDIKIERRPEYTNQTLQSFSNFIYVDFTSRNKHKPGGDFTRDVFKTLKELKLNYPEILDEYSWGLIQEFDEYIEQKHQNLGTQYTKSHVITVCNNPDCKVGTTIFSISNPPSLSLHFILRNYERLKQNKVELLKKLTKINLIQVENKTSRKLYDENIVLELKAKDLNFEIIRNAFEIQMQILNSKDKIPS